MKNYKKEIMILTIILIVTIIGWLIFNNMRNKKMLLEEIQNNKITDEEKTILKINRENKKVNNEIKILDEEKTKKEIYKKCLKEQLFRIWESKEVIDWYCETEILPKTPKIEPVSVPEIKKDITLTTSNLSIAKSSLFLCMEVKNTFWLKSDEYRCATMMTLVKFLETKNWETWIGAKFNNMYWLKNPTDKKWLKGNWEVMTHNNLKFETKEIGSYAFAYYYMKYHDQRNMDQFVDRYVAWNNTNYKAALKQNYDWVYSEYTRMLN